MWLKGASVRRFLALTLAILVAFPQTLLAGGICEAPLAGFVNYELPVRNRAKIIDFYARVHQKIVKPSREALANSDLYMTVLIEAQKLHGKSSMAKA